MTRSIYFAVIAALAGCGPFPPDGSNAACPAVHPGVCIALGLPDSPVLFRPCDIIAEGVCQYRVFDYTSEANFDKITTCERCLSDYFDPDSVRDACAPYHFDAVQ
jgi:hypothetical protein